MPAVNAWAALQGLHPLSETGGLIVLVGVVVIAIVFAVIMRKEMREDDEFEQRMSCRPARRD